MKKQQPVLIVAGTIVVLVVGYFVYDRTRPKCDSIFDQTATRVGGNLQFIQTKGELFIGRDKVQELTDGAQKVALHLKTCCLGQQSGTFSADQFQGCLNGAKEYESKVVQVTAMIREAQTAKDQGNTQLSEQKAAQASEAAGAASTTEGQLAKLVGGGEVLQQAPTAAVKVTANEQEPNNTILEANLAEMGTNIAAAIVPANDVDYFKFTYRDPKNRRDIVAVHLENQSATLRPQVRVDKEDKSALLEWTAANAEGANWDFSFSAEPGKSYFVAVKSYGDYTTGKYVLSVKPQKAYDAYEPNDDAFTATPISVGQVLEANIMDGLDQDWYRLSGLKGQTVNVHLDNQSTTLRPMIRVLNADKSVLQDWAPANVEGANLDYSFPAEAGKEYFIIVTCYSNSSAGKYKLSTH